MSAENLENIMKSTMDQIRNMIDPDMVVGSPIKAADETTLIPISKITYGFGSGGGDIASKHNPAKDMFNGGGLAGVSVVPVAFLIVSKGTAKVIQIEPYISSLDRVIENAPDIFDKFCSLFKKDKSNSNTEK